MRIGVFGGTFDPPHIGHQILADECLHQLNLDKVLWVLTFVPPHKTGQKISSLEQRLAMVQAAISDRDEFVLSRVDIDRPAPHYAVETVRILRQQYPNSALVYLMGGDSLRDLPHWHTPREFVRECDEIGVMRRPNDTIDLAMVQNEIPEISTKLSWIEAPLIDIASHEIRRRAKIRLPIRYYLPGRVYQLIWENNWYQ